jgi:hypothetical protein
MTGNETNEEIAHILQNTVGERLKEVERRVGVLEKNVNDILNKDVREPYVPEAPAQEK